MAESIKHLRQHDGRRARDDKRVIIPDLPESLDEIFIWVTLQIVPQSPRRPVGSLRIYIGRID